MKLMLWKMETIWKNSLTFVNNKKLMLYTIGISANKL